MKKIKIIQNKLKDRNLNKAFIRAQKRFNKRLEARMEELKKDKQYMSQLDKEIETIKTKKDLDKYVSQSFKKAQSETSNKYKAPFSK